MTESQRYAEVVNLLHRIASNFATQYKFDFDDLRREADIGFLKAVRSYDPTRGSFSHWVYCKVTNELIEYCRRERLRRKRFAQLADPNQRFQNIQDPAWDKGWLDRFLDSISNDARTIVEMILNPPQPVAATVRSSSRIRAYRGAVREHCRSNSWTNRRITEAFRCIEESL